MPELATHTAELHHALDDLHEAANAARETAETLLGRDPQHPADDPQHPADTPRGELQTAAADLRAALNTTLDALDTLDPPCTADIAVHTPPSMNNPKVRSTWAGMRRAKKELEADLTLALDAANLPRPIPGHLHAHVTVQRPLRRTRDDDNYWIAIKALGDALTSHRTIINGALIEGGWLPNDTRRNWTWNLEALEEPGPDQLHIHLTWRTR